MGGLKLVGILILKDWRLFRADRRAVALAFAVPILLASLFGVVFDRPGGGLMNAQVAVALVLLSEEPAAVQLDADLEQSPSLAVRRGDRASAEADLAARRANVAIVIGDGGRVEVLHHPLCTVEGQYVRGLLTEAVMRRRAGELLKPLGLTPDQAIASTLHVETSAVPGESAHPFNSYSHSFCGMTLQYLLFWGMECGLLFLRERQRGIWRRLRVSPAPFWALALGRVGSTAGIALAQILVTFGFGYLAFGVTVSGSWPAFLGLALGISGLSAATGMVVAAAGGTEARARHVCILAILAISILGGLWLPAFLLPAWVGDISLALPTTWAMRELDGLTWQGSSFAASFTGIGVVWLYVFGLLALALWRLQALENRRLCGGT